MPFAPGGPTDLMGRLVGKALQEKLKVPVIVENRGGGSAIIGSEYVVNSNPDGSTLLFNATHQVTNPVYFKQLPYDTEKDFSSIALVGQMESVLVVNPELPVNSTAELIKMAQDPNNKLSMATFGGANQLATALFQSMADTKIVEVGYKGAAPSLNDVIAGHLPLMFNSLVTVAPHVEAGTVRALAVTGAERSPYMPDVPTVAESGPLPGYSAVAWWGLFMPYADNDVPAKLSDVMLEILNDPEFIQSLRNIGADPGYLVGAEFEQFVSNELIKWQEVGEKAGIEKQ